MPRIAQHGVNESYLELTDLEFGDPTPNTVVLTQKAILHSPSMYTPTLDPFNATSWLVTNGTFAAAPLTQILMPRIHALHPKSNVTAASQQVTLSNPAQIAEYATEILAQKNVSSALTGKTTLHEGKLPSININFNSTLTYAGMFCLRSTEPGVANCIRTQWFGRFQRHQRKGQHKCYAKF
jgi:hypothetical protein